MAATPALDLTTFLQGGFVGFQLVTDHRRLFSPHCGMQMLDANLTLQSTRLQSNKFRTKSSSMTLP